MDFFLPDEAKKFLLKEVRETICARLENRAAVPAAPPEACKSAHGAFVTLKKSGDLRGCIGRMQSARPLHETIRDMAEAAAFDDPRFPPLDPSELSSIDIEITVLSPLVAMADPEELRVGRHGLYLISGTRAGVLLPQVAVEYGWERYEFLAHTCRKAGLPPDAWKWPESRVYLFEGLVFGESVQD
ncbi:MAG: AmmeMemoRadiSam system protein A [Rectinemataceae bacterium]